MFCGAIGKQNKQTPRSQSLKKLGSLQPIWNRCDSNDKRKRVTENELETNQNTRKGVDTKYV